MLGIFGKSLIVCVIGSALAGCAAGSSLLNGKGAVPSASNVPVGNSLTMPPDLQLQAPQATSDAYQPNGYVAPPVKTQPGQMASMAPAAPASNNIYGGSAAPAPAAPTGDAYEQAGISKIGPDGKPKSIATLNKELSAYYMAKKRQQNPGYGSIGNIGAIFRDE
ncbi:hypothetical protein [Aestuariivirga litoralis]|uniref:hypothetical protein n=1 Tax=Aestuariivirga litoralis TaxID=2650924 RepID=UPI0018C7C9A1|nr:hypothetical protein [Aestuariivirga litoralis]MBG1232096.1 hypothetical protein [Aestuariivirga litoralis]